MCGRYRLSRRKQIIEEHFDSVSREEDWTPRYNVAPTHPVPIIRQNPKEPVRQLSLVRWDSILEQRHVWRGFDDKREIRDGSDEACVP
jgi:putative SOS response-associated peptidase YedK